MAATIVDIKQKTGLSLATISKYLNGGNVLPENRVKIEAAINELHYEVNEIARGLVTNKTKTIGILVYSIESLFNGTLVRYVGEVLRKKGYGLLICDSCEDEEVEKQNLRFLINKKVDGIIVIPENDSAKFLEPAVRANIPIVVLDRTFPDGEFDCIKIDNRKAGYKAAHVLIDAGHRDVGIICSEVECTGVERYKGFVEAMEDANIPIREEYMMKGKHSISYGYESMKQLIKLKHPPTAVLMTNYEVTLGAVMAINELGVECPKDISLCGFDDLVLTNVFKPKLHLVAQPMQEMSERAVEMLLQRMNGESKGAPIDIVLGTFIREGNSVRKL